MFAFDMSIPVGHLVETEYEARQWMNYFLQSHRANGGLGLDSETTGLVRHRDVVLYWSLSDGKYRICLPSQFIQLYKEPILENPEINFDLTNAPFDAHMFANSGADISKAGIWRDTRVQSWLLNENNQGRHGLKECTKDHFQRETPSFESIFGKVPPKKKDKLTGRIISKTVGDLIRECMQDPDRKVSGADYASLDAYNSTCLRSHFDGLLKKSKMYDGMSLFDYFYAVEAHFTKVLWKMERRGITLDAGYLKEKQGPMEMDMARIEKEFAKAAGRLVNLNSTNDIRWFFFELLKKEPIKWTDGGTSGKKQPSTDAEVLEEWAGKGEGWAKLLLEHRGVAKIHGTYVTSLQELIDHRYRIHTSLNQIGTVTGRLSSSDPNLQNIPRPGEDKFRIREAFIPGERRVLIVADYEQLEMRLMAHFSGDEKMIKAIHEGVDLHCLTVSEMNGIPYDDVMAAKKAEKLVKSGKRAEPLTEREEELLFMRQAAKATGFGIIYGIGGPRLAANLTKMGNRLVTEEEGWRSIKKWFGVFPRVESYINEVHEELWRNGKVQTIMGRWRRFGDLKGMSKRDSSQAERQGVNSIVQGSASDVAKMAMMAAEHDPEMHKLGAELLLQVHDELIWECPDDPETIKATKKRVKEIMELPFGRSLKVPLPVEVGHGYSWADAK
jgi:DNA polymerase I